MFAKWQHIYAVRSKNEKVHKKIKSNEKLEYNKNMSLGLQVTKQYLQLFMFVQHSLCVCVCARVELDVKAESESELEQRLD